jgi:hypothetical protein
MPHIAEGLLHAWLDGALGPDERLRWTEAEAHLEVCDDCRRRLEEAGELRDAASALLAAVPPARSAARPPFDELLVQAEARRAGSSSGRDRPAVGPSWWRTPAKLAWAASLVIAVGAGWIGRQLVVEQGLDAPRVTAEQEAIVGRSEAGEGAVLDEAEGRDADAAVPPAPEAAPRLRADEDARARRTAQPQVEEVQDKAAVAADDRLEATNLAKGLEGSGTARCYAASREARDDEMAEAAGRLETLRLAADGTASLLLDGRPMVGFWETSAADSLRLRITDGGEWRELTLIEFDGGVRGAVELDTVACP